jgi:glycosyltransferase involved in cell wall biosynthesis
MRVLQVMGSARPGGAEGFFARLCRGLSEAGVDQEIVIRKGATCLAELRQGRLDPIELPFTTSFDIATRSGLSQTILAYKPDIVFTWMNRATTLCPSGPFLHIARMGGYYSLKYYKRCDHLIGNTAGIVDYCRAGGWPEAKTHYLPNFADEPAVVDELRPFVRRPGAPPTILALGRLHKDKAFDVLLKALVQLPGVHLQIAGIGPEGVALERQAARLGVAERVVFLGWRTDTGALLDAADCLVCPSRVEPLGNVILEAWARRRPVVAAASLGPASLIEDGRTGLMVPMEDETALAQALQRVVSDPVLAEALATNGRAEYVSRFSKAAVVAQYTRFLKSVLTS